MGSGSRGRNETADYGCALLHVLFNARLSSPEVILQGRQFVALFQCLPGILPCFSHPFPSHTLAAFLRFVWTWLWFLDSLLLSALFFRLFLSSPIRRAFTVLLHRWHVFVVDNDHCWLSRRIVKSNVRQAINQRLHQGTYSLIPLLSFHKDTSRKDGE